jgi:outer membrane protein assembly factor BamB
LAQTGFANSHSPEINQTKWTFNTGGQMGSPTFNKGFVYVGSYDRKIYAFNVFSGEILWSYTTGSVVFSRPAVADGIVCVGSEDYNLYALNATTGDKLWNYTT